MSRPLIGVTTSEVRLAEHTDPLPEGDPPQREMALGMVYMRSIERAGGIPVVLPPLAVMLGVLIVLWVTSDDYRGVHTGIPTYAARHEATGLDDPTTQILHRGVARVEDR